MSTDKESKEAFLSRWSRLKKETETQPPAKPEPAAKPKPELPPVESLTPESDFSGFLHPEVDEKLRRAALRKLFSDPHFNVMDGLDVYIGDYSKADPIPEEMLRQLNQFITMFGAKTKEEREPQAKQGTVTGDAGQALGGVVGRALPAEERKPQLLVGDAHPTPEIAAKEPERLTELQGQELQDKDKPV